jgi:ribosomal protein S27AE
MKLFLFALLVFVAITLGWGCAAAPTDDAAAKKDPAAQPAGKPTAEQIAHDHANQYTKCKNVAVNTTDAKGRPATEYKHVCPKCQGAVETFLAEGKMMHKCGKCGEAHPCPY